jgi:hypothetical protein
MEKQERVFTTAAVVDLLSQIDELSHLDIGIEEKGQELVLSIGDSAYKLSDVWTWEVPCDDSAIEEIASIDEDVLDAITYNTGDGEEYIESGLIKSTLKAVAIGGMVLLTGKLLKSDRDLT